MRTKLLIIILLFASSVSFAQRKDDPAFWETIKTKKVAFITEKVGLTSQEAEKFWPIYNKLESERFALMDQKRKMEENFEKMTSGKSEAEYKKMANDFAAIYVKEGRLIDEYNVKLLSILPSEKVVKLYFAEGKFRSYLMHEYRKNDQGKRGE